MRVLLIPLRRGLYRWMVPQATFVGAFDRIDPACNDEGITKPGIG